MLSEEALIRVTSAAQSHFVVDNSGARFGAGSRPTVHVLDALFKAEISGAAGRASQARGEREQAAQRDSAMAPHTLH